MSKCIDLTGQKFGKLTVLKRVENTAQNKAQWLCRCDCGEEIIAISSPLRTGRKICCSKCSNNKPYKKDLAGQRFGRLVVLEYDEEYSKKQDKIHREHKIYWKCKCDCGKITYAKTADLNNGSKKSCGCLQKEIAGDIMKNIVQPIGTQSRFIDLTNKRFGKLVVISRNKENDTTGRPMWTCKCDCGNTAVISGHSLKGGYTQSCGCIGRSLGEAIIEDILKKYNIFFEKEYSFKNLKDKTYLRYDFAILDDSHKKVLRLIEYDGRQHSDITSIWYSEDLVRRDSLKTEYAKQNNIPLLRISYQDKDNIEELIKIFIGVK